MEMFTPRKAIFACVCINCFLIILISNYISIPEEINQALVFNRAMNSSSVQNQNGYDDGDRGVTLFEIHYAKSGTECAISSSYPQNVRQWCILIQKYAWETGLDSNLVAAIILYESDGNSQAYSQSGAVGLMQIMPSNGIAAAFQCQHGPCFSQRPTMQELFNPEFNIYYGTLLFSRLLTHYGNLREALRMYGPSDCGYSYADEVLRIYTLYK